MEKAYVVKIGKSYVCNNPIRAMINDPFHAKDPAIVMKDHCKLSSLISKAYMFDSRRIPGEIVEQFGGEIVDVTFVFPNNQRSC